MQFLRLTLLVANEPACYRLMDVGRRHEIPGLGTEDFITAKAVAELHSSVSQFSIKGHDRRLHVQCIVGPKGKHSLLL